MQYIHTNLPKCGIYIKRNKDTSEVEVWNVEVAKVGVLKRVKIPGRHVYQTSDGKIFAKAFEAGEHELELVKGVG